MNRFLNKIKNRVFDDKSLLKGMFIYSIGTFGSKVINFIIYPLLTFFLTREELGYYDLVINSIYLMIPLATLQLGDGVYRRLLPKESLDEKKEIISTGFLSFSLVLIPIVLVVFLILNSFYDIKNGELVLMMTFLYSCNATIKQMVRGLKKNNVFIIAEILYSLFFVLLTGIFLSFYGDNLTGVFISFVLTNLISIFYLMYSSNITSMIAIRFFSRKTQKELLQYSIPLIPNSISWWLVGSANTFIVTSMLGFGSNGIYAIAFKFSSVIYLLNKVFSLAWQDHVILDRGNDDRYNSRILNKLLFFLLTTVLVLTVFTKLILGIFVSNEFYEAWQYVPYLLMATAFSSISTFFGAFYLKWGKTNKIFTTTLIGAATTIISSLFFTRLFGLTGTSLSVMIGFMLVAITRWYDTRRKLCLRLNPWLFLFLILIIISTILNFYI